MTPMRLLVPALMGLCVQMAIGQTVYRCGDHYTDQPCPGATPVPVQDARSAEQQVQAKSQAARERQLADSLEKRRLHDEARAAQAAAASSPPPAAKPASPAQVKQAQVKQARRARWKVRRAPTVRPQPAASPSSEPTSTSQGVPGVPGTNLAGQ